MRIPIYQVDAFADRLFAGNPAAICVLEQWLPDATLQAIAAENNLSETAYLVRQGGTYEIRWFTPASEVDLCGHATLASAFVIMERLAPDLRKVSFETRRAGRLEVARSGQLLAMDFPSRPPEPCGPMPELAAALGAEPHEVLASRDYLAVFATPEEIAALRPDFAALARLERHGTIVTAPARDGVDFVSRFFAPAEGIDEDPVTGSAHCTLVPYWAARLGRTRLEARQISRRGGSLSCELRGDRVIIAGRAVLSLEGWISV